MGLFRFYAPRALQVSLTKFTSVFDPRTTFGPCRHHEDINMRNTLRSVREDDGPMRTLLRAPDDAGGGAVAVAQPWVLQAADSFRFPEQLPPLSAPGGQGVSPGDSGLVASAEQGTPAGGVASADGAATAGSGAQVAPAGSGATTNAPAKRARRPQHCIECGHKMRVGAFKVDHPQFLSACQPKRCNVPANLRRVATNPQQQNALRKFGGECECTGSAGHPGGCRM